jgi:hypothetical protein
MPFEPFTVPDSIADIEEQGGARLIPEGAYLWEIVSGRPNREEGKGSNYIAWTLKAVRGPVAPGLRFTTVTNWGGGAWLMGHLIRAAGADPEKLRAVKIDSYATYEGMCTRLIGALRGKVVGATIEDDMYNGNRRSQVKAFWSQDQFASRATAVESAERGPTPIDTEAIPTEDLFGASAL